MVTKAKQNLQWTDVVVLVMCSAQQSQQEVKIAFYFCTTSRK